MDNNKSLEELKQDLVSEIEKRVEDKIIEQANADLLKKLINQAETETEAMDIAALGTTYKRTGFHFDKRLERISNNIKYKTKNEHLSFVNDASRPTHELIIGDNYDALQNLLITHKNSIDVIYIDPPYGKDNMGDFAQTNYENSITRDNLLSMLYPRLLMAKRLLTPEGVIFCSIDDKNQAYVKCLFDEVFGEENFSGVMIWQKKKKPSFLSRNFGTVFEYILCFVRDYNETFPFSIETTTLGKKYPFNNAGNSKTSLIFPPQSVSFNMPDGIIKAQDMSEGNIITKLKTDVVIKDGRNENEFELFGEWRYSQASLDEIIESNGSITISKVPFRPNYVKDGGEIKKMKNYLSPSSYECDTNEDGTEEYFNIMVNVPFDNPKPSKLLNLLLKATTYSNPNATILDFFAGSGTTGQAVMELNKQDGGNRTFILCTNNEVTDSNPNGIAYDVTAKRLKRVMSGKCYDGTDDFPWIKNNKPYMDNLNVYEIAQVSKTAHEAGETAFDKIDETCYGLPKFAQLTDKIAWICSNFENATKDIEKKEGE